MTTKYWMREANKEVPTFCPVEISKDGFVASVVTGLTLITDHPDGIVVGEFWFDDEGELHLEVDDGEKDV